MIICALISSRKYSFSSTPNRRNKFSWLMIDEVVEEAVDDVDAVFVVDSLEKEYSLSVGDQTILAFNLLFSLQKLSFLLLKYKTLFILMLIA